MVNRVAPHAPHCATSSDGAPRRLMPPVVQHFLPLLLLPHCFPKRPCCCCCSGQFWLPNVCAGALVGAEGCPNVPPAAAVAAVAASGSPNVCAAALVAAFRTPNVLPAAVADLCCCTCYCVWFPQRPPAAAAVHTPNSPTSLPPLIPCHLHIPQCPSCCCCCCRYYHYISPQHPSCCWCCRLWFPKRPCCCCFSP